MIIVCFILLVAIMVCDSIWWDTEIIGTLGAKGAILSIVVAVLLGIGASQSMVIDDQIALYEDVNQQIDNSIYEMVVQYQGYEEGTFEKLKGTTADTLISLYPELKTDILVNSQMEIYVNNQREILKLKEYRIKLRVVRWWLYFGK